MFMDNRKNKKGRVGNMKQNSRIKELFYLFVFCFFVFLQIMVEKSARDTLLPICIPWMYSYLVLGLLLMLPFLVAPCKKLFCKKLKNCNTNHETFILKAVVLLIIVSAIVFIPNRYISIRPEAECQGIVVDKTSVAFNKTPSFYRNYVKIQLDGENTSFWYCLNKNSKPLGSRCVISVRRGIFGMRYVEKADFFVEMDQLDQGGSGRGSGDGSRLNYHGDRFYQSRGQVLDRMI